MSCFVRGYYAKNSNIKIYNDNVCYIGCDLNNYDNNVLISNGFNVNDKSFCSLLGISYYLDKDIFF